MSDNYRVNLHEVFLTGISNGAGIVFRAICELDSRYKVAGAAPVVGSFQHKDGQQCKGACFVGTNSFEDKKQSCLLSKQTFTLRQNHNVSHCQ